MIKLNMHSQPTDETCGPTSLCSVYEYYNDKIPLKTVIEEVERSMSGGTLAPMLGSHALGRGSEALIYINNLKVFDPTWFTEGKANSVLVYQKLEAQIQLSQDAAVLQESKAYLNYLSLGGQVYFKSLDTSVLRHYFEKKLPIITGLNATYLYRCSRERFTPEGVSIFDDVNGQPCGHFVVLCGYDEKKKLIVVADPHRENPLSHDNYYKVSSHRLINAIMLGVTSYDANLLIIHPKETDAF